MPILRIVTLLCALSTLSVAHSQKDEEVSDGLTLTIEDFEKSMDGFSSKRVFRLSGDRLRFRAEFSGDPRHTGTTDFDPPSPKPRRTDSMPAAARVQLSRKRLVEARKLVHEKLVTRFRYSPEEERLHAGIERGTTYRLRGHVDGRKIAITIRLPGWRVEIPQRVERRLEALRELGDLFRSSFRFEP